MDEKEMRQVQQDVQTQIRGLANRVSVDFGLPLDITKAMVNSWMALYVFYMTERHSILDVLRSDKASEVQKRHAAMDGLQLLATKETASRYLARAWGSINVVIGPEKMSPERAGRAFAEIERGVLKINEDAMKLAEIAVLDEGDTTAAEQAAREAIFKAQRP